jgi:hypothetical protein
MAAAVGGGGRSAREQVLDEWMLIHADVVDLRGSGGSSSPSELEQLEGELVGSYGFKTSCGPESLEWDPNFFFAIKGSYRSDGFEDRWVREERKVVDPVLAKVWKISDSFWRELPICTKDSGDGKKIFKKLEHLRGELKACNSTILTIHGAVQRVDWKHECCGNEVSEAFKKLDAIQKAVSDTSQATEGEGSDSLFGGAPRGDASSHCGCDY